MPLGRFIWSGDWNFIEYYVQWLSHYRANSHEKIYKNGTHNSLAILPQIGKVTEAEQELRARLEKKGLLSLW